MGSQEGMLWHRVPAIPKHAFGELLADLWVVVTMSVLQHNGLGGVVAVVAHFCISQMPDRSHM